MSTDLAPGDLFVTVSSQLFFTRVSDDEPDLLVDSFWIESREHLLCVSASEPIAYLSITHKRLCLLWGTG